jgi:hypothetical protein
MGGDLLMPGVDELDLLALADFREQRDVRVPAKTEYVFYPTRFKVSD